MRLQRIGIFVTVLISVVTIAIGLFVVVVKLDFSVHAIGRVEPKSSLELAFPVTGKVSMLRPLGPVKKGELIAALDSDQEEEMLKALAKIEEVLNQQLSHQREIISALAQERQASIAMAETREKTLRQKIEYQQKKLDALYSRIATSELAQKELAKEHHEDEVNIVEALNRKGLVSRKEVKLAKFQTKLSKGELAHARLTSQRDKVLREQQLLNLQQDLQITKAELEVLEKSPNDKMSILNIQQRKAELQQQREVLQRIVKNKRIHAPFDGRLTKIPVTVGQIVKGQERIVAVLMDESQFLFRGKINSNARLEVTEGQDAQIMLDNYPHYTYGYIPAKVQSIETQLAENNLAEYTITFKIDKGSFVLHPGLTGRVEIFTFRGTTYEYLTESAETIPGIGAN